MFYYYISMIFNTFVYLSQMLVKYQTMIVLNGINLANEIVDEISNIFESKVAAIEVSNIIK